MITHDELTDMMAARLSKGEDLDLIYTNPKNHIVCFIPTYEPGGGDSTKCYFVDGREELVCLPMRTITRELAVQEGLRPNYIMTSDGRRSSYTSPKTYGPHLTFAHIKCRRPVGKDVVYGLFNVAIPYEYIVCLLYTSVLLLGFIGQMARRRFCFLRVLRCWSLLWSWQRCRVRRLRMRLKGL